MTNYLFKFYILCTILLVSFSSSEAANQIQQTAIDFTQVAKDSTPAVASIKIKKTFKKNPNSYSWNFSDEDDFFGQDFLKKFFNIRPNEQDYPTVGQASGFLVSADGYLLTNSHVVEEASEVTAILPDGREFTGTVVGHDPNTDIAIVKIEGKDLPFLHFGNSDQLQPGQWAIAIGNPFGLQASLTVGVVSATGRNNLDLARIEDFIQTDAAINRGNSGGPLLNIAGEVIGMNTAIVTMTTGGYMGVGFAIPSNLLKHIMEEIISSGKVTRGFVGVILQQMDQNLAKAFNLPKVEGAVVAQVTKDSPAETAGLMQGDVVLKYNQTQVTNIAALRNAIALMKPGSHMTLTVLRDNKTLEIPIDIGAFPLEKAQVLVSDHQQKENKFGFAVQELTPELAKKLSLENTQGVVIAKVDPNTPGTWVGLKKDMQILEINKKRISSVAEFNQELDRLEKGQPLLLLIRQGDTERYVSLLVN